MYWLCRFAGFVFSGVLACAVVQAVEHTSATGITLVDIPAGSFLMGSCKPGDAMVEENKKRAFLGQPALSLNCSSHDADDETPQHHVSIKAFQMGKTEVTLGQFKKYIVATGRTSLVDDDFMKYNAYGDDAPVVKVSWQDARDFIRWLNQIDGGGWRLPSEAEWEYACRAGGNHTYCGSNSVGEVAWYEDNSGMRPHAVATKKPNGFGLHDMSGNVLEWIQDCWHDSYQGAPVDGSAWTRGVCTYRVLRGGSWNLNARNTRAVHRNGISPGDRSSFIGFRLARSRQ